MNTNRNKILFTFFPILFFNFVFSQVNIGYFEDFQSSRDYKLIDHHIYVSLEQKTGEKTVYWRKNEFNLSEVHLYSDSSFVYFYVSKHRYDLTVGTYKIKNREIIFNWDSLKTYALVADSGRYNAYFRFKTPNPFKLIENRYLTDENVLLPQFEAKAFVGNKKIELFASPNELETNGKDYLAYRQLGYDYTGNKIYIDDPSGNRKWFERDSIWGFALYENNSIKLYRTVVKGFNWYSIPGIKIVELSKMVIYTIGDGRTYSYFSEDLKSTIYPLNLTELKKVYKNNAAFLKLLSETFSLSKPLNGPNEAHTGYKVVELYLKSLSPMSSE